jgi:hypothetical protein
MQAVPKTKAEARETGASHYFTGRPCPKGHLSLRYKTGHCVECLRLNTRERYREDPSYAREWQKSNRQKATEAVARWRAANPKKVAESRRRIRETQPKKVTHDQAVKRAKALGCLPSWVDRRALRAVYDACPPGFEVDHIHPLKHESLCGLHVPWNLQYLTRAENVAKRNTVEVL